MAELASELRQLAQLVQEGVLTQEEFAQAKAQLLSRVGGPAAAAEGGVPGASCRSCGASLSGSERFCLSCGASLVESCPVCAQDNALETRFCANCGSDLMNPALGFDLERAKLWRQQFQSMGWWDDPNAIARTPPGRPVLF